VLEADAISARYGHIRALSDVTLSVRAGEVISLIGPNGAGKSTLLRVLAGAVTPDAGRLQFDGNDVTAQSADERARAGVALCPEGRAIFVTLTVEENLRIGAAALRGRIGRLAARGDIEEGLERAFGLFPVLRERRHLTAGSLSGGQQQMLALARSLMSKPRLLLLDEPSLGLAPRVADDVYGHLEQLHHLGQTMVVAEESPDRSLGIADRAYVLLRGSAILSGDAETVRADPALRSVYLGEPTASLA
jgi:branched-chain amino acid transport system ATP-binding protein